MFNGRFFKATLVVFIVVAFALFVSSKVFAQDPMNDPVWEPAPIQDSDLSLITAAILETMNASPSKMPVLPPGLYVSDLIVDPVQAAHGQNIAFAVAFSNTSSGDQNVKWKVYVYRADNPIKSNTESAAVPVSYPPGMIPLQSVPLNFKLGSTGNNCDYFFARVATLDNNNQPNVLNGLDGKIFEKGFAICQ